MDTPKVKNAIKALTKKVDAMIPENEKDDVEYYLDTETPETYHWRFLWKEKEYEMVYHFDSKKIDVLPREVRKVRGGKILASCY